MAQGNEPVRIVVAEDEAIIRLDLVETLVDEGYEIVASTGRGDEAVTMVEQHRPDVAILDIKMPGIDGIEAAARIVRDRLAAVLILTAYSQRDLIARAAEAGALAYLVKPFQRSELVPAVEMARARFAEIKALGEEVADLEHRLVVRKLLDRAKGRLMDLEGMTEAEAFRRLQQTAMRERRTMEDVAHEVLGAHQ